MGVESINRLSTTATEPFRQSVVVYAGARLLPPRAIPSAPFQPSVLPELGASLCSGNCHLRPMPLRTSFIRPSLPVLTSSPPVGPGWLHEIKFDGYRAQLHKNGDKVALYSKNGKDFTARFKAVARAVAELPAKSFIIDAEIVANDAEGRPDFRALHSGAKEGLSAWCFDLLALDGRDCTRDPLTARRKALKKLFKKPQPGLLYSESFDDAEALLRQAVILGLEGIVSKRADQPYVSGTNRGWLKVKTHDWREANKERGEMFHKPKQPTA